MLWPERDSPRLVENLPLAKQSTTKVRSIGKCWTDCLTSLLPDASLLCSLFFSLLKSFSIEATISAKSPSSGLLRFICLSHILQVWCSSSDDSFVIALVACIILCLRQQRRVRIFLVWCWFTWLVFFFGEQMRSPNIIMFISVLET